MKSCCPSRAISLTTTITACPGCADSHRHNTPCTHAPSCAIIVEVITYGQRTAGLISGSFLELAARCFAGPTHTLARSLSSLDEPVLHRHDGLCKQFRTFWAEEVKRREKKGGEKTVLSFGQPLQPRRRGGCLSKPKNHHQLTCKAILHHHDRLFKRPQGFL